MASADLKEELNCSICLEVYTDPVTLRCGHNYCRKCINRALDSQRRQGVFTCPECRTVFKRRPWLQKNVTLSNIAQRFQPTLPDEKKSGVECTYCIHAAVPAVQHCLHCDASLCDSHLKAHSRSPEHVLVEPTASPQTRKCPTHNKILQHFCTVDSACVCAACAQGPDHRRHRVQPLGEASEDKKKKLSKILAQLTSTRQETEKRLRALQEKRRSAEESVGAVMAHVDGTFRRIRQSLDILEAQTVDQIAKEAEKNAKPVTDLIRQLEDRQGELCGKICHVEELCHVTDPVTLLQEQESTKSDFCVTENGGRQDVPKIAKIHEVFVIINLHKQLSAILTDGYKVNLHGTSSLRLDKKTAASNVAISPDSLMAYGTQDNCLVEDTDERFDSHQVLSTTGLDGGRHYWEAELCDTKNWRIGMSYFSIDRDGGDSIFGNTNESWCLCKSMKGYSFRHDGNILPVHPSFKKFKRLGVFLDYKEGRLSFYSLEPEVRHMHTFYCKFKEPLHVAIRVAFGVWVKILN